MTHTQTGLTEYGTEADESRSQRPKPDLLRVYNVSGRLVHENDIPNTAAQREEDTFSFSIHHYPIDTDLEIDCPLLRVVFGAHHNAWFDIGIDHVYSLCEALFEDGKTNLRLEGAQFSTHDGTATFSEGLVNICVDVYSVRWGEDMCTITLGDSVGAGAEADLSPKQTADLKNVITTLANTNPDECGDLDGLSLSRVALEANGEVSTTLDSP